VDAIKIAWWFWTDKIQLSLTITGVFVADPQGFISPAGWRSNLSRIFGIRGHMVHG
jgi:hypothetical protein